MLSRVRWAPLFGVLVGIWALFRLRRSLSRGEPALLTSSSSSPRRFQCFEPEGVSVYMVVLDTPEARTKPRYTAAVQVLDAIGGTLVPAVSIDNITEFRKYLPPTYGSTDSEFLKKHGRMTGNAHIVQTSCYLSHLNAMQQAYADGAEYALILEDDISFYMPCMWPANLTTIIQQANRLYGDWHLMRLKVGGQLRYLLEFKELWMARAVPIIDKMTEEELRHLDLTYGTYGPDFPIPLSIPYNVGTSSEAFLFSREGLRAFLERYIYPPGSDITKHTQWSCPRKKCTADGVPFFGWNKENQTLAATPPLFTSRHYDASQISQAWQRPGNIDVHHDTTQVFSVEWLSEATEMFRPPYYGRHNFPQFDHSWHSGVVKRFHMTNQTREWLMRTPTFPLAPETAAGHLTNGDSDVNGDPAAVAD